MTPRLLIDFVLFYTDLELAAEIGQNLLDRNKELEVLLKASQQYLEEQGKENEVSSWLCVVYLWTAVTTQKRPPYWLFIRVFENTCFLLLVV